MGDNFLSHERKYGLPIETGQENGYEEYSMTVIDATCSGYLLLHNKSHQVNLLEMTMILLSLTISIVRNSQGAGLPSSGLGSLV